MWSILLNHPNEYFSFSLNDIADLLLDRCVNDNILPNDKRVYVKEAIMLKKHHLFEKSTVANNLLNSSSTREKSIIKSMSDHTFFQTSSKISKCLSIKAIPRHRCCGGDPRGSDTP